ncbi:hypothetical protein, partial [Micromonospora rosaria]
LPWGVLVVRTVAGGGPRAATVPAGAGSGAATVPAGAGSGAATAPAGVGSGDATVAAGELLAALEAGDAALPVRRDAQWRWPLPPPVSRPVETLPAAEVHRIAEAAAGTLRTAVTQGVGGRAVGQRALRDALLDHVPVVVTPEGAPGEPVEVSQRLIQAVVRMGFLGRPEPARPTDVGVRVAGRWVGLVGPFGAAWSQKVVDLAVTPA